MIDLALWLIRWTIAGAAISTVLLAAAFVLERNNRFVGLGVFRAGLLLCLAAPLVALYPPAYGFSAALDIGKAPSATADDAPPTPITQSLADENTELLSTLATGQQTAASRSSQARDFFIAALFLAWLTGAASCSIAQWRAHLRLDRIFRRGKPFDGPKGTPQCRLSGEAPAPLVFGLLSPRMIAPADFAQWGEIDRLTVFRHEAAHVRRGDLYWAFLGEIIRTAYWWVPPVRFLASRHILATEQGCDAHSMAPGEDRRHYAQILLSIARRAVDHPSPGLAMARASSLRQRVERLLTSQAAPASRAVDVWLMIVATAAGFALALTTPGEAANQNSDRQRADVNCACTDAPPFIKPWPVAKLSRQQRADAEQLIHLIKTGVLEERTAAARALADWPTAEARGALHNALGDDQPPVRAEAVLALAKRPENNTAFIIAALDDPSCNVVAAAAEAMADLRLAGVQKKLIAGTNDKACVVRRGSVAGLSGYLTHESADALQAALTDRDERVRAQAASSLSKVGDGGAIVGLLTQLRDDTDKEVRQAAAEALGKIAPRGDAAVINGLVAALRDSNEYVRHAAAQSLMHVGDARAENALINALSDENEFVRTAAAAALGRVGGPASIKHLRRTAENDPNSFVRAASTEAAARLAG